MPLPELDAKVRARFDKLMSEAKNLIQSMKLPEMESKEADFEAFRTKVISLLEILFGPLARGRQIIERIEKMNVSIYDTQQILGMLVGLRSDYEAGMLQSLPYLIEANVVSDYLGQAEQLLGEGGTGQYNHVPAAVLAGAVLEDALRRLCQRQNPSIDTHKPDGNYKTLDPLNNDLQKANVFNKAKSDMLKSWAKIRNYAAHGEFAQFRRQDVEPMIVGVKQFLADYL